MACKRLTIEEYNNLPQGARGYDSPAQCPSCVPCPCSSPQYCCTDGNDQNCMGRLTSGSCNTILFRKASSGADISPGFKWMIQAGSDTHYSNENPSPAIASSYCPGDPGFWQITVVNGVNPCGFGYNCFIYYRCQG